MPIANTLDDTSLCVVIPASLGIPVVAVVFFIFGLYHDIIALDFLLEGLNDSSDAYGLSDSCQGTLCHERWRNSISSCEGLQRATFQWRYIMVGVFGVIFGFVGIHGVTSRNSIMVKTFGYFLICACAFFAFTLGFDLVYVKYCDKLSLNMAKDVMMFVWGESRDLLEVQGYRHIEKIHVAKLKDLIGQSFELYYCAAIVVTIMVWAYFAVHVFSYAEACDDGPLGIGPVYLISTDYDRDMEAAVERMKILAGEFQGGPQTYDTLQVLKDAQTAPYINRHGDSDACLPYGVVGVDTNQQ